VARGRARRSDRRKSRRKGRPGADRAREGGRGALLNATKDEARNSIASEGGAAARRRTYLFIFFFIFFIFFCVLGFLRL
jgi:hypothetical protein